MAISAKEVMALRERTGLGMMDCKKALLETDGDIEAAEEALRIKLKGKMDSRTDRAAGEGRIAVAIAGDKAAIVEINSETDFTARNDQFVAMTQKVAELALAGEPGAVTANDEIDAAIDEVRIATGENCGFARGEVLQGGKFAYYVHHDGKTGVLLQVEGDLADDVMKDICLHITAAVPRPVAVDKEGVPADLVEKERHIALEQAKETGKPEEIARKIVEGKIRKFYEDIVLLEQHFVKDDKKRIRDLLGDAKIVAFRRYAVGEAKG
ncbi:MAG TPA: translation elongation factor Ts [Phycisphaeraceae bacterium]|nr:translation elongation factor Ts [Phycisphaeraceae bacterium]